MRHEALNAWVQAVAEHTRPEAVRWCDGSTLEARSLEDRMVADGTLLRLNDETHPKSFLHRSSPTDVARTEHLTFICSSQEADAGPTNNWMAPDAAERTVWPLFAGAMKGRTMYVVPYVMGPAGLDVQPRRRPAHRQPVRRGQPAPHDAHGRGRAHPARHRRVLRQGGAQPRRSVAGAPVHLSLPRGADDLEHRLRLRRQRPPEQEVPRPAHRERGRAQRGLDGRAHDDRRRHQPPGREALRRRGLPERLRQDQPRDARPEPAGLEGRDRRRRHLLDARRRRRAALGHQPGGGLLRRRAGDEREDQPERPRGALARRRSSPTWRCARTARRGGKGSLPCATARRSPTGAADPGRKGPSEPAAHPNARFTVAARQCPTVGSTIDDPRGVPISAIVFGGRRARLTPLVYEALDWAHGVYVGATLVSETTAAATGAVGVPRNDPMAMIPFCGLNMADYFGHWLSMGTRLARPPRIFHVNWFRTSDEGKFLWPGFGENIRVLKWILERLDGKHNARTTPIGRVPTWDAMDLRGLDIGPRPLRAARRRRPQGVGRGGGARRQVPRQVR